MRGARLAVVLRHDRLGEGPDVRAELDRAVGSLEETTAFFVVAEAVATAWKHSGARSVSVEVGRASGRTTVEVCDDGVGGVHPPRVLTALPDRVGSVGGRLETRHSLALVTTGACGYLLKDRVLRVDDFLDAVRRIAEGGTALDPEWWPPWWLPPGRTAVLAHLDGGGETGGDRE